jgi:hypothetical protein
MTGLMVLERFANQGLQCRRGRRAHRMILSGRGWVMIWSSSSGRLRFEVSHPCDKNKNIARMGHPAVSGPADQGLRFPTHSTKGVEWMGHGTLPVYHPALSVEHAALSGDHELYKRTTELAQSAKMGEAG